MFDARQLARWRLDENLLPAHSTIRFREPTIWDRYGQYIIGGGVLLLAQTLLIAGLLLQRSSRRRAEMELRSSYEQIRSLSRRLLTAQEAERAHLSREIHDDISQQMVALQFDLQKLKNRLLGEDEVLASETSTRAASVTRSLRHLSHRLHPAHIRLVGLTGAVSDLGRELSTGDVSIAFLYDNVPDSLSPDVMLCFYRVAQEALSNALKHSQGSRVNIQIRGTAESLTMVIEDDGVGFDVTNAQRGLGLVSMRERVEQIGGSFRLRSLRAEGTQVQVHVPLSPAVPGDVTASGQSVTTV
jgi:signal transduction histidine kinase